MVDLDKENANTLDGSNNKMVDIDDEETCEADSFCDVQESNDRKCADEQSGDDESTQIYGNSLLMETSNTAMELEKETVTNDVDECTVEKADTKVDKEISTPSKEEGKQWRK